MGKLKEKREKKESPPTLPTECPIVGAKIQVLEIDLAKHETRVTEFTQTFRDLLREHEQARERTARSSSEPRTSPPPSTAQCSRSSQRTPVRADQAAFLTPAVRLP